MQTARKLAVNASCDLLKIINSKKNIEHFFEEFPVSIKVVDVGVIGNTPEVIDEKFIFSGTVMGESVFYFTKNPNPNLKRLETAHEETFEEAKRIVCEQQESYPSQF